MDDRRDEKQEAVVEEREEGETKADAASQQNEEGDGSNSEVDSDSVSSDSDSSSQEIRDGETSGSRVALQLPKTSPSTNHIDATHLSLSLMLMSPRPLLNGPTSPRSPPNMPPPLPPTTTPPSSSPLSSTSVLLPLSSPRRLPPTSKPPAPPSPTPSPPTNLLLNAAEASEMTLALSESAIPSRTDIFQSMPTFDLTTLNKNKESGGDPPKEQSALAVPKPAKISALQKSSRGVLQERKFGSMADLHLEALRSKTSSTTSTKLSFDGTLKRGLVSSGPSKLETLPPLDPFAQVPMLIARILSFKEQTRLDAILLAFRCFTTLPIFLETLMQYFLYASNDADKTTPPASPRKGSKLSLPTTTEAGGSSIEKKKVNYLIQLSEFDRRKSIIEFLSSWMDVASNDFIEDKAAYQRLEKFIQNMVPIAKQMSNTDEAKQVEEALTGLKSKMQVKFLRHWTNRSSSSHDLRKGTISGTISSSAGNTTARKKTFTIEEMQATQGSLGGQMDQFGPEELAQQLTLIHYDLVSKIRAKEFIRQAWNKPGSEQNAPNLLACIKRLNWGSRWYSTMILKGERAEQRAGLLTTFIKIAEKCESMRNYNGLMEVISSLHSAPISRLKHSWKLLSTKTLDTFTYLSDLMSPFRNYQKYRSIAAQQINANVAFIPFIGVFLTDFTFMDDANPDEVDGEFNWEKALMMGNRIKEFVALNANAYSFAPSLHIQSALFFGEVLEDNELYRISLLREDSSETAEREEKGSSRNLNLSKLLEGDSVFGSGGKKSLNLTETLTDRDWMLVLTGAKPVKFQQNAVIIQEATSNTKFYRIKSGKVNILKSVTTSYGEKEDVLIVTLGPPEVVGEMSVLGGTSLASASVIAASPSVEMYEIKVEFMHRLFSSQPELAERFFKQIACKLSRQLRGVHNTGSKLFKKNVETILGKESSDTSASKEAKQKRETLIDKDTKFRKKFGLGGDEVVIQDYECAWKKRAKTKLAISQRYICLAASSFGKEKKYSLSFMNIAQILRSQQELIITTKEKNAKKITLKFRTLQELNEAASLMIDILHLVREDNDTSSGKEKEKGSTLFNDPNNILSEDDWKLLFRGSKSVTYKKDQVLLTEGEENHCIYKIYRGNCAVVKELESGAKLTIGSIGEQETFGETSFFEGTASASVIVATDEVELGVIESHFLRIVFDRYPKLAGRFYHHLTTVLSKRILAARQKKEQKNQKKDET